MTRLGVFGGAFDPIHNGHLFVAEAVREAAGLDRVLFVPTGRGAHRGPAAASIDDRAAMVRAAIAPNCAFGFDDTDLHADATGYTLDLLPRLARRYPEATLTFIVGGDSLVRSQWRGLDDVLRALEAFVVAPRGTVTAADLDAAIAWLPADLRAKIRYLALPVVAESATMIRERLAAGASVRYLVPEPVFRYLEERRLYRTSG